MKGEIATIIYYFVCVYIYDIWNRPWPGAYHFETAFNHLPLYSAPFLNCRECAFSRSFRRCWRLHCSSQMSRPLVEWENTRAMQGIPRSDRPCRMPNMRDRPTTFVS